MRKKTNALWASRDRHGVTLWEEEPPFGRTAHDSEGFFGEHFSGIPISDELAARLGISLPMNSKTRVCGLRLVRPVVEE